MLLLIGDTHFQTKSLLDCKQFKNELELFLKEEKSITAIVLLGDTLHYHNRLDTSPLNLAVEFIKMCTDFHPTFILVGNHDMINCTQFLTSNHWLNVLKEWPNLTVVDKPIKTTIKTALSSVNIVLSPFVPDGMFIKALDLIPDWKDCDLILGHQLLDGAKMGAIIAVGVEEWKESFPMLISGHIHDKQTVRDNFYYTGSSMQHAFGESHDKTIALVDKVEGKINIKEIKLNIAKKRILYMEMADLSDKFELPNDVNTKYQISLNGSYEEFKAFKKGNLYKKLTKLPCLDKIKYRHKRSEIKLENKELEELSKAANNNSTNFNELLLLNLQGNTELIALYNSVISSINKKEEKEDEDVIFIEA